MQTEKIKIKGHRGTWSVIDKRVFRGRTLYLLEHEMYGDEAASLIVDKDLNIVLDDVWNGWLDLEEAFEEA